MGHKCQRWPLNQYWLAVILQYLSKFSVTGTGDLVIRPAGQLVIGHSMTVFVTQTVTEKQRHTQ
jgi:hypothetical protein